MFTSLLLSALRPRVSNRLERSAVADIEGKLVFVWRAMPRLVSRLAYISASAAMPLWTAEI